MTTKPTTASVFLRRDGNAGNPWAFDLDWYHFKAALRIYIEHGDINKARDVFRRALSWPGANPRSIFHAWIYLEHRDIAAIRACFEEWRSCGGGAGYPYFWCRYATFELLSGTAARARAVAKAAMAACPRDPVVFAMCAKVELRLGRGGRARRIVRRAREVFTADEEDEDAAKWVEKDVELYRRFLRLRKAAASWPTISHVFRFFISCGRGTG